MLTTRESDNLTRSTIDYTTLLIVATVLFGLSVRANAPKAGIAAAAATVLCAAAFWMRRTETRAETSGADRRELLLAGAVLVFAVLGTLDWAPWTTRQSTSLLERLPDALLGLLAVYLLSTRARSQPRPESRERALFLTMTAVTLLITFGAAIVYLNGVQDFGVDVFWLHRDAAEAIAEGANPYTDAVEVRNGAPGSSPDGTIVGYPYPPVVALSYSVGEWVFGDARFTSLLAWLGVLALVGVRAYRRRSRNDLFVMLLLAAIPGWPLVLRAGWTEPLSLLFLTFAFFQWRKPTRSGAAMGLGLASKQYFVIAAPLLLLHRDEGWPRRLLVAAVVVVVTIVPVFLLDPGAFWSAAVEFHLGTPVRTDSVNLVGAVAARGGSWLPPRWIGPALGLVVAAVAGRFSRDRRGFFLGLAVALSSMFLLASQALANYWFLIAGLIALCLTQPATEETQRAPRQERRTA